MCAWFLGLQPSRAFPSTRKKVIQLFARCLTSPKILVSVFSLLFLYIFRQRYIYSCVRVMSSSSLVAAVVAVVTATVADSEIVVLFARKSYAAKPYNLHIWQFQCFDASQRRLELLRIKFIWGVMYDLGNLYLKTLLWKVWPHHSLLYSDEIKKGFLTVMYSSSEGICKPLKFFSGLKWSTI